MAPDREVSARQAIFGGFDGLTVALGVLLGASHGSSSVIVHAVLGGAIAEGVGMAAAAWLSQGETGERRQALVLGGAAFTAAALPVVPYLFLSRRLAALTATAVICLIAVALAGYRGRLIPGPDWVQWVETAAVLTLAAVITWAVTLT